MVDFSKFVEWAFMAIMASGVGWSARFLAQISQSITTLNNQISILVERTEWHQKELEAHSDRITELERYRRNR